MILLAISIFTTTAIGLFAGAALHIAVAEQPARLALETRTLTEEWRSSFKRAFFMQGPLAVLSVLSSVAVWFIGGKLLWLAPAGIMAAIVGFTIVALNPLNRALNAERDLASTETRRLVERWGRLHTVRVPLALIAALCSMYLLAS